MMDPFKARRQWKVNYQYGVDGIRHELNLSRLSVFLLSIVSLAVIALAGLYFYNLSDWNLSRRKIAKLEQENLQLRQKLDYYSDIVDSIYRKLDTLDLLDKRSKSSDRYYPYYQSDKTDPVTDNTFVYDTYLDARVNSVEQQIRQIATHLDVESYIADPPDIYAAASVLPSEDGPSIWPAFGRWSDGWGTRVHPYYRRLAFHYGLDISNKLGTPIYATAEGEVILTGYDPQYGKLVKIKHSHDFETRYGHLYCFRVAEGDLVRKGQIIALMGSTGHSTGPHLHYEVLIDGHKVNPARYLNRSDDAVYYTSR